MSKYSLVVFDWDGTVMDSTPSIVDAIQASCRDLNLPEPAPELASWVIGLSLDQALQKAVPNLPPELLDPLIQRYKFHYLTRDPLVQPFAGIVDLFEFLSKNKIDMAVATGKSRVGLNRVLKETGFAPYFAATRCASETFSKPHPMMLLELMDELMVAPEHVVMIGDTTHDILMAKNAGVDAVAVSYGAHSQQELLSAHPNILVHNVAELKSWLSPQLMIQ